MKPIPTEKKTSIETTYSWIILAATFLIYAVSMGGIKSYGILSAAMIEEFHTSTGTSTAIGVVCTFMQSMLGPLANSLCLRFSYRSTMVVGGVLIGVGYALGTFVKQVEVMFLTHGIVAGTGYALVYVPCITMVNYFFDTHRGLANGVVLSASGVGGFSFPYLYTYLFNLFGLRGGLLILGGVMFNICIGACVIRQPRLIEVASGKSKDQSHNDTIEDVHKTSKKGKIKTVQGNVDQENELFLQQNEEKHFKDLSTDGHQASLLTLAALSGGSVLSLKSDNEDASQLTKTKQQLDSKSQLFHSFHNIYIHSPSKLNSKLLSASVPINLEKINKGSAIENTKVEYEKCKKQEMVKGDSPKTRCQPGIWLKFFVKYFSIDVESLKKPSFYAYLVTFMFATLSYTSNFYLLPPYAKYSGYTDQESAFIMFILGLSELFCRIAVGWFVDLNLVSVNIIYIIFMSLSGIAQLCVPFMTSFSSLGVYAALVGALPGSFYTLMPIMLIKEYGMERLAPALATVTITNAVFCISSLPLLGFLRDQLGNWTVTWILPGSLMVVSGLIILALACRRRWQQK